jgi:hypothetical protein
MMAANTRTRLATIKVEGYGALWAELADNDRNGRDNYFDLTPGGPAHLVMDWDERASTITLLVDGLSDPGVE